MVVNLRRCFLYGILVATAFTGTFFPEEKKEKEDIVDFDTQEKDEERDVFAPVSVPKNKETEIEQQIGKDKTSSSGGKGEEKILKPDTSVHIFYYPWYGNPAVDNGSYYHWNHRYLPHWDKAQHEMGPPTRHEPPDDIGSSYYPKLGCYSSRDLSVIHQHFQWIHSAGVGVVAVSWYPPGMSDEEGRSWDEVLPKLLDSAKEFKLKVAFHIEPFKDRNVNSLRQNISYILKTYGSHPAFYYYQHMGRNLPLFYIYDSYLILEEAWQTLLSPKGALSVRGTKLDAFYIGLLVNEQHKTSLLKSGFDGFYTYFAADSFTYGSTRINWPGIRAFAKKNRLIFIPSVGPGYVDVRIRDNT